MMFGLHLDLTATGAGDLHEHVDTVAEQMASTEQCNSNLLDFSIGADAETGEVEIEVTVQAESVEDALATGISWIRSAIHAAGAGTPGWEDGAAAAARLVEYRLDEATTKPFASA